MVLQTESIILESRVRKQSGVVPFRSDMPEDATGYPSKVAEDDGLL